MIIRESKTEFEKKRGSGTWQGLEGGEGREK